LPSGGNSEGLPMAASDVAQFMRKSKSFENFSM